MKTIIYCLGFKVRESKQFERRPIDTVRDVGAIAVLAVLMTAVKVCSLITRKPFNWH